MSWVLSRRSSHMKKVKLSNIVLSILFFALAPALAFADSTSVTLPQGFSGIFSCNQDGAYAMSVGALGATGGIYVPVADATVELNTGTLVYKECVLREIVDAQRQVATAGVLQRNDSQILTSRNGSPQFSVNRLQERQSANNQIASDFVKSSAFNSLDPAIQQSVKQAVAQNYINGMNAMASVACAYPGATADFTSANTSGYIFDDIRAIGSPCNPIIAYQDENDILGTQIGEGDSILDAELSEGQGYYPVTSGGLNPLAQQVVTPGSFVNSSFTQIAQSPFNQLQNANDLGQMVNALFAGVSTQITSPTGGGINGISQPIGSTPSYLQQAVTATAQNLQGQIINAAVANLTSALQVEEAYFNIMNSIAQTLISTIAQLRSAENQCWQKIIQNVCATPIAADGTCTAVTPACSTTPDPNNPDAPVPTCPTAPKLKVATSTAFSQAVIDSQITATAQIVANNSSTSKQALNLLNGLIQSVTGSNVDAQASAIAQLNQLVANNLLHTQPQANAAQQQQNAVQGSMQTLLTNTINLWAGTNPNDTTQTNLPWDGTVSPGAGWCDFQSQSTLQQWEQKWQI